MKIIDFFRYGNTVRLYYGENDCNDYWGDDWDDAPYEHNAGQVYQRYIQGYVEFTFPLKYSVCEACNGYFNSPFSKEDMKNRKIPCITISNANGNKLNIYFEDDTDSTFKAITGFGGVQLASYDNEENSVIYNKMKGGKECMDEDAKQASIPYTYNAPEHDWKCGYPIDKGRYER